MGVGRSEVSTEEFEVERGGRFSCEELFQCPCTTRYGTDMERALWGGRELYYAVRRERWTLEGSSLCPSGPLLGNKKELVPRQCRVIKTGYRLNVEAKVVFFKGFPEGAVFGSPLYKVFFYPRLVASVVDMSRLTSDQDLLDGGFVPRGIATP